MSEEAHLSHIVTSIITENRNSHCRLCLKPIESDYVRFCDNVSLYPSSGILQPLAEILNELLGENICEEIPGLEVVCTECVNSSLELMRFLHKCKRSTDVLNLVLENLVNLFSNDIKSENKKMFLVINNLKTTLVLLDKDVEKYIQTKQSYTCLDCEEVFESFSKVYAHNLSLHNIWTCETCAETFISKYDLTSHKNKVHKYKCVDCSHVANSEDNLKEHQDQIHNVHVCTECGKSLHGLDKLHIHEEKHKTKNSCPKCGKTYTTKEFYEKHVDLCFKNLIDPHPIRSTMPKSYMCVKCQKAYSTPGGLRVHNRFVHGNAKPHVCTECGKTFTAPSYLKVHMIKHTGEKNFKCYICNNKFVTKEALLYHTRRHTGEKPYSCKHCNEKFVNASARAEHIKFKHVGPTLMCEICSRKFVTTHFLKQHISRHHNPTSKLYYGRNMIPPNSPAPENVRRFIIKAENSHSENKNKSQIIFAKFGDQDRLF